MVPQSTAAVKNVDTPGHVSLSAWCGAQRSGDRVNLPVDNGNLDEDTDDGRDRLCGEHDTRRDLGVVTQLQVGRERHRLGASVVTIRLEEQHGQIIARVGGTTQRTRRVR